MFTRPVESVLKIFQMQNESISEHLSNYTHTHTHMKFNSLGKVEIKIRLSIFVFIVGESEQIEILLVVVHTFHVSIYLSIYLIIIRWHLHERNSWNLFV
jgi:hypothetical protein